MIECVGIVTGTIGDLIVTGSTPTRHAVFTPTIPKLEIPFERTSSVPKKPISYRSNVID